MGNRFTDFNLIMLLEMVHYFILQGCFETADEVLKWMIAELGGTPSAKT